MRVVERLCLTIALTLSPLLTACYSKDRAPAWQLPAPCDVAARQMDLSSFREFHLDTRHIAFGFLEYNVVESAAVVRDDDGRYLLDLVVLEQGICGIDDCIWQEHGVPGCPVLRTAPERYLDREEVEWLQDTFRRLSVCPDSTVFCSEVAPYVVKVVTFRWDDFTADDDLCYSLPTVEWEQASAIWDLLWDLYLMGGQ